MGNEGLSELWHRRELLYFFAWREVKVRYKQAALGATWAIIQPLLAMVVFTFFFGRLAGLSGNGIPYPIFVYSALVPWTYFSGVIGQAGNSLVGNANLVTKVYFPRVFLPASLAAAGLLDLLISASLLVVLMLHYQIPPTWALLLVPFFAVAMMAATLGMSLLLAAMNVRYRDVKYVLPFLVQLWMFCTPVIYPVTIVPTHLRPLLALNPLAGIVEGFRACLFPQQPFDVLSIGVSTSVCLVLLGVGIVYFSRTQQTFADII